MNWLLELEEDQISYSAFALILLCLYNNIVISMNVRFFYINPFNTIGFDIIGGRIDLTLCLFAAFPVIL